jgi:hypothetical protein
MNQMANLALEGGDPRDPTHPVATIAHGNQSVEQQQIHAIHDHSVTFEEYMYYAAITRAEEKEANARFVAAAGPKVHKAHQDFSSAQLLIVQQTFKSVIMNRFSKGNTGSHAIDSPVGEKNGYDEKNGVTIPQRNLGNVSDAEWKNASRAVRTAGWTSVFYLITTDILGPFSVP